MVAFLTVSGCLFDRQKSDCQKGNWCLFARLPFCLYTITIIIIIIIIITIMQILCQIWLKIAVGYVDKHDYTTKNVQPTKSNQTGNGLFVKFPRLNSIVVVVFSFKFRLSDGFDFNSLLLPSEREKRQKLALQPNFLFFNGPFTWMGYANHPSMMSQHVEAKIQKYRIRRYREH